MHGDWCTDEIVIFDIIAENFSSLSKTLTLSRSSIDAVLYFIKLEVSDNMNSYICAPFTTNEVRRALFNIYPSKMLGLDGFTTLYFQKTWLIIRDDVSVAVLVILNEEADISSWNKTLVSLIPKSRIQYVFKISSPSAFATRATKLLHVSVLTNYSQFSLKWLINIKVHSFQVV